jgi:hypothetical protein
MTTGHDSCASSVSLSTDFTFKRRTARGADQAHKALKHPFLFPLFLFSSFLFPPPPFFLTRLPSRAHRKEDNRSARPRARARPFGPVAATESHPDTGRMLED